MDTRHRAAELTMALAQYETPKQRVAFRLPARTIDTDKTDMPDKGGDEAENDPSSREDVKGAALKREKFEQRKAARALEQQRIKAQQADNE